MIKVGNYTQTVFCTNNPEYGEKYDKAFVSVLLNEGGYVNDPDDKGGETKYGTCKRSDPHCTTQVIGKLQI